MAFPTQEDKSNISIITKEIAEQNSEAATVLSKIISPDNIQQERSNRKELVIPSEIKNQSSKLWKKIKINDDILELFPDAQIAVEIIVSAITCPNDLLTSSLIYTAPEDFPMHDSVKKGICEIIEQHIDKYYKLKDKLPEMLKQALFTKGAYVECIIPENSLDDLINSTAMYYDQQALSNKLQKASGTESFDINSKEKNFFLGSDGLNIELNKDDKSRFTINGKKFSFPNVGIESIDNNIIKTSNTRDITIDARIVGSGQYEVKLPLPKISEDWSRIKNITHTAKEISKRIFNTRFRSSGTESISINKLTGNAEISPEERVTLDFLNAYMKTSKSERERMSEDESVIAIKTKDEATRKAIGRPLVFNVPVESIIPVHSPLDCTEHLGYFVVLDENGSIVDFTNDDGKLADNEYGNPINISVGDSSDMISKGRRNTQALTTDEPCLTNNEEIFTEIVYEMLSKRLKDGAFGDIAKLNRDNNNLIYKLMFRRALQNKATEIVFLPSELVSYYAFEYRDNGTGKSLFEKTALLYSIRATLLMTSIIANVKNSINTTNVDITLPEEVTDADAVLEQISSIIIKNREHFLPLGLIRPTDIQEVLTRMGYKFSVSSPNMPEIKIDANDSNRNITVPNQEVDDKLMEMQCLTFGITPDMIKQGFDPEFATAIVGRQNLLTKRIKNKILRTNELNSIHVRKILKNDEELRHKIFEFLASNFQKLSLFLGNSINEMQGGTKKTIEIGQEAFALYMEKCLIAFEEGLEVCLPEQQVSSSSAMMDNLNAAFSNIDTIVDAVFSSDVISQDLLGETIGNKQQAIIGLMKSALKKAWVTNNDALPEFDDMFIKATDIKDTGNNTFTDFFGDLKIVLDKFSSAYRYRKELSKESDEIKKIDDEETTDSWGDSSSSGGWGDSGSSDDSGSGDDSGGGDDGGFGFDDGGDGGFGGDEGGDEGSDQNLDESDDDNPTKGTDDEIKGWDSFEE